MGLIWVLSAPDGPHVGPMNIAIKDIITTETQLWSGCFVRYEYAHTLK